VSTQTRSGSGLRWVLIALTITMIIVMGSVIRGHFHGHKDWEHLLIGATWNPPVKGMDQLVHISWVTDDGTGSAEEQHSPFSQIITVQKTSSIVVTATQKHPDGNATIGCTISHVGGPGGVGDIDRAGPSTAANVVCRRF